MHDAQPLRRWRVAFDAILMGGVRRFGSLDVLAVDALDAKFRAMEYLDSTLHGTPRTIEITEATEVRHAA